MERVRILLKSLWRTQKKRKTHRQLPNKKQKFLTHGSTPFYRIIRLSTAIWKIDRQQTRFKQMELTGHFNNSTSGHFSRVRRPDHVKEGKNGCPKGRGKFC